MLTPWGKLSKIPSNENPLKMWRTRGEKTSDFPFKTGLFHRIHKHYYNYPYLLFFFSFFRCAEGDRRKRPILSPFLF